MNETIKQLYDTIERMERNANGHEDRGETNTAIQLRHWAEQFRETLNKTKNEWNQNTEQPYSCFCCDDQGDGVFFKPHSEPTNWYIGMTEDGQAHYACEECKLLLYNVVPVDETESY